MNWLFAVALIPWTGFCLLILWLALRWLRRNARPATDKEIARFKRRPYRGRRVYPDWPGPEGEW